jgi:hypothetical protein
MRKFRMEIEGLWVNIFYEYTDGDEGDYCAPPTAPRVDIKYWELDEGEAEEKERQELSDNEWEAWLFDIEEYVWHDSEWDIIEFEESLKY